MISERPGRDSSSLPPKRWHDGIRDNIPGNLISEDFFISTEMIVESGISFFVLSLTSDNQEMQLPEGIYLFTNIPKEQLFMLVKYIVPVIRPVKDAISTQPDTGNLLVDVPGEISPEAAGMGAKINLANTIGIRFLGCTTEGGIILSLITKSIEDLKRAVTL